LEKACAHLGFTLDTNIPELDKYAYLPSNPSSDFNIIDGVINSVQGNPTVKEGVPRPSDYGYFLSDYYDLMGGFFNVKYDIDGTVMHVKSENDPYWKNVSQFNPKPIADKDKDALDQKYEERRFNIADFKANTLLSFSTDSSDTWTSAYFEGTNYEIIARVQNPKDEKLVRSGGLKKIDIPMALGNRKSQLTEVEATASAIVDIVIGNIPEIIQFGFPFPDGIADILDINRRLGALRISQKSFSVPKVVYIENGNIPPNHRSELGAKHLWNTYWNEISFVDNDFGRQRQIVENEPVPFTGLDLIDIETGSFFTDINGKESKATRVLWTPDGDTALMNSWKKSVYCNKLFETFIEPK
jgi:hypothetical protein